MVGIKWNGLEDCTVNIAGHVDPRAAQAAVFFVMPSHYKINIELLG